LTLSAYRHSRIRKDEERSERQERTASEGGPYTNFEPLFSFFRIFLNLELTTDHLKLHAGDSLPYQDFRSSPTAAVTASRTAQALTAAVMAL
jgi:hypothetical protein